MSYNPLNVGAIGKASSRQTITGYQNGTGLTIIKCTPVSTNASGQIIPTDVSDENSSFSFLGLCSVDTPTLANGQVINGGRLEAVTTGFSIGDALWISKASFLTNIKPNEGSNGFVAGDFVIFIGVVVKNEFDVLKKDIMLAIEKIGQL